MCLYSKNINNDKVYIILYVDDIIIASNNVKYISNMYEKLCNNFELTDLGDISYYLDIEVTKDEDGIYNICQTSYIGKLLRTYKMEKAKESKIPLDVGYGKTENDTNKIDKKVYQSLVGALIYNIATNTRIDITTYMSVLSRKMNCPTESDWLEAKRVVKYLKGTKNLS